LNKIEIVDEGGRPTGTAESWTLDSLNDLWFLCSQILSFQKEQEYRDLNWVHQKLCDFLDPTKQRYLQLLVLMARDMLKSSIGRGMMLQWFLNKAYQRSSGEAFIYCGILDLAKEHLEKIVTELLDNELIQSLFRGRIPSKKSDQNFSCRFDQGEIVYRGQIRIVAGSPERPIAGKHFELGMIDNLNNEVNTRTVEMRKIINRSWQVLESVFKERAREVVFETTWAIDDISGIILDPESKFDYLKLRRNPCFEFTSNIGYRVFSCPATSGEGEIGEPVFPEKIDLEYLERKRAKQGRYLYSALYELLPIPDSQAVIKREWWDRNYENLPSNYTRHLYVDAAGTLSHKNSPTAVTIADWDELGNLYISYASKRWLDTREAKKWVIDLFEMCLEEGRPIERIIFEKEKFGMAYGADVQHHFDTHYDFKVIVGLQPTGGLPRRSRQSEIIPYYERNKVLVRPGLKDYEDELRSFYVGKDTGVDIIDTIWGHLQWPILPQARKDKNIEAQRKAELDKESEEFRQFERDRQMEFREQRSMASKF
jgi:hypothetical protein